MATLKGIVRGKKSESLSNSIMVDTVRGVLRVRKWPRKRGTPTSERQLYWINWFKQANLLAKYVDAASMIRAIQLTKGSGMYPRDVLLKAMRGRLYTWQDQSGKVWYPMAAVQDISESLDVLAQAMGSVLVRAADRWRAPPVGADGMVLTHRGVDDPPEWRAPAGGGGISSEAILGTPIVVDGTKSFYDIDVESYASLSLSFFPLKWNISDQPAIRFSIDGGTTFKTGAGDYRMAHVTHAASGYSLRSYALLSTGNSTSPHYCYYRFNGLRAGPCVWVGTGSRSTTWAAQYSGAFIFTEPITHIRVMGLGGNNMISGTIYMVGDR